MVVLRGENLGGRHDASLAAVVEREEHGHEGDDGFAAADVALEEAVHLATGAAIGAYLAEDPFLGVGEGKRKMVEVEIIEIGADGGKTVADEGLLAVVLATKDVELD